jgi:hypothetical protein
MNHDVNQSEIVGGWLLFKSPITLSHFSGTIHGLLDALG